MVGRFAPYKGIDPMCEALAEYWRPGWSAPIRRRRAGHHAAVAAAASHAMAVAGVDRARLHLQRATARRALGRRRSASCPISAARSQRSRGSHVPTARTSSRPTWGASARSAAGSAVASWRRLDRRARRCLARTSQPLERHRTPADADVRRSRGPIARVVLLAQPSVTLPLWETATIGPPIGPGAMTRPGSSGTVVRKPSAPSTERESSYVPALNGRPLSSNRTR